MTDAPNLDTRVRQWFASDCSVGLYRGKANELGQRSGIASLSYDSTPFAMKRSIPYESGSGGDPT